ncbi:MAG: ABC transporter permease [Verrucomicrobiota bacterium]
MRSTLRLALRSLLKSPGFTAIAIITLALGIGLNTSMFSALHAIFLRTLPYPDGDRLVRVYRTTPQDARNPHSPANFLDQREQNAVFSGMAALQWTSLNLAEGDRPAERLHGMLVTGDFFPLLGIPPALGRVFTPDDGQPGASQVVVLSHELWSGRFAADPDIVGREVHLGGQPVTVVGVMPPGFNDRLLFGQIDAWRPLVFTDAQRMTRRSSWLTVIARLKPGVSLAQAQSGMDTLAAQLALAWPDVNTHTGLRLVPLSHGSQIEPDGKITWFVTGLAGAVLLLACANLANLQFARTAARAREFAVRTALGASRTRLMFGVLAESLLLALAGGALGVLVALWCNDMLGSRLVAGDRPGLAMPLDLRALGFASVLSAATGLLFGLLPAWLASQVNVGDALKQGGRGATAGRAQHRVRHALIVAEVALALVLLASAAFFVGGLKRFAQRDLGWRTDGLFTASFDIGPTPEARSTPERLAAHRVAVVERWEERLARIPGIERVAFARRLPTYGYGSAARFAIEGRPDAPAGREPLAFTPVVTPGYFETLGLRLVAGRSFTSADRAGSPPVTIINESMARALWPGESPLGKRIGSPDPANRLWREIVGVVGDARSIDIGGAGTQFQMYRPWAQAPEGSVTLALRAAAGGNPLAPEALAAELRRAAAEIDPGQPVHSIASVRQDIDRSFTNLDLAGWMLAAFALLGVLLAALGIYAVIAHSVVQRTHEIGVRLALGAQVRDVLALVVGRGLRLALIGTALGLAGAWAVARLLGAIMPAVPAANGLTLSAAAITLLAVALLACWLPARRATKVDPMVALRAE